MIRSWAHGARLIAAGVFVALLAASVTGQTTQSNRPVVIYGPLREATLHGLARLFFTQTGVRAEFERLPSAETAARLQAESGQPRADILLGLSWVLQEDLRGRGLLDRYASPARAEIPARYRDADGYWTGTSVYVQAIAVNLDRFHQARGLRKPRGYEDLLDPRYRGQLVVPSPTRSPAGFAFLFSQFARLGEERAWDFLAGLDRNVHVYTTSRAAPAMSVGAGEYLAGITYVADALLALAHARPLRLIYPPQTGWDVATVSIAKNAPNAEGARRFIDWMLTRPTLNHLAWMTGEYSVRSDIAPPRGAVPLRDLDLVSYDVRLAAAVHERLVREWARRFDSGAAGR